MELLGRALLAPREALRSLAGGSSRPVRAGLVLAGTAASVLAAWLVSPPGPGRLGAAALSLAGRAALDLFLWLLAAALLRQAADWLAPAAGSGQDAGVFLSLVAVAAAFRSWLLPVGAVARIAGLAWILTAGRAASWIAVLVVLWLGILEACRMSGPRAALCLVAGLALPAALAVAGLALAGLGWLLSPLFPGGVSPFPQL